MFGNFFFSLKNILTFLALIIIFILLYLNIITVINTLLLCSIVFLIFVYFYVLKSENKLEALDYTGYGIIKVSSEKGVDFFNEYALNSLGYISIDLLHCYYYEENDEIVNKDYKKEFKKIYFSKKKDKNLGKKVFKNYENKYQCRTFIDTDYFVRNDGTIFPVEYIILPIISKNKVTSIVITFRDITERKVMQDKLLQITEELKSSNRELESFSYSVSHDLRAPLRHISGFINLLQNPENSESEEEKKRYLGIILKSTKKMGDLIDDLLVFSRVSRSELQISKVDLNEVVHELKEELCSFQESEKKIIWNIQNLPIIKADRKMIRLALMNLMTNAIKFTKYKKEAKISISSEVKDKEVILKVEDNGIGFEQKYVDKIFGVFQRLHGDSEFEGTGIGLANVLRIIGRHNGRVWAIGSPNEGAKFFVSLPI